MKKDKAKVTEPTEPTTHRKRNWLIAIGLSAILPAVSWAAAERLRRIHDPEAGEVLSEPLGEKGRYITSFDGARIYTEEIGSGPTIVLIHGWFCNTDMWHYQKKALAGSFRMVCYDQRGHRRSDCPDSQPCTLETMARDLKAVLDEYAPNEPVVLAGHSMGGISILKFAQMFSEELGKRVRAVALVDTSNVPMAETIMGGATLEPLQKPLVEPAFKWAVEHPRLSDGVKRFVVHTAPFLLATRYLGYGSGASLTQMEYIQEMAEKTTMKGACLAGLGLLRAEETIELEPLRRSGIPLLIWVGEKDKLTRPEVSIRMKLELPDADFHLVHDTGHPSYMEEYGRFNEALEELCARAFAKKKK